ncbi:hypothetical protein K3552_05330 [Leisingera aquaemixtae]|uniref:hypothetical protein n=1 Tax=Leisingera aquaemixtae TaxID=1396826 RepID=UPI0021A32469|nr:hypothetical protein [Leisingera aquaemixtae]UWQ38435.1 hypothetical protein K3552_05330 [Leisingera aquaemixtae]
MRPLMILLLAALPAPLAAGEPLGAAEFDRYTQGRTLFYGFGGSLYGVERYLPGRRVVWSFLDGKCQDGSWYEEAGQICFIYDNRDDPQCWTFELTPGGLTARFEDDPAATELYEAEDIGEDMLCYGPDVGT